MMESADASASTSDTQPTVQESSSSTQASSETVEKERSSSISSISASPVPATSESNKPYDKIKVLLKPVGDAPILKQKVWTVDADKPISSIIQFTKQYLRLEREQNLFFFVNQAFAPSPDQLIRNLYECFGSDGKLILHYSTTVAWG